MAKTSNPTFSRIAEKKGNLTIVSVADRASTSFSLGKWRNSSTKSRLSESAKAPTSSKTSVKVPPPLDTALMV